MNKIETNESYQQISPTTTHSIPDTQTTSSSLLDTLQKIILAVKDFFVSIGEKISNFAKSISERIFSKETPAEPTQLDELSSVQRNNAEPITNTGSTADAEPTTLEKPNSLSFFSRAIEKTISYAKAFGQAVWNHKGKIGLGIAAAGALYFASPYLFSLIKPATIPPKPLPPLKCYPVTMTGKCFLAEQGKIVSDTVGLSPLARQAQARRLFL